MEQQHHKARWAALALMIVGMGSIVAAWNVGTGNEDVLAALHRDARSDTSVEELPFEGLGALPLSELSRQLFDFGLKVEISSVDPGPIEVPVEQDVWAEEDPDATFAINGDSIDTSSGSPESALEASAIWERFVHLIPADQRQMVVGFELLPISYEGAYVYATDGDPTKWMLGVASGLESDLDSVLIHEFGHLLTLQAKEVPPSNDPSTCSTYFTGEGCALSGSTFAGFVANFWPQSMIDRVDQFAQSEDWDGLDGFYWDHQSEFVTDYAVTNPGEDLAETFTMFVITDRPSGATVADQKIQYLWSDAKLVALRLQIRSAM